MFEIITSEIEIESLKARLNNPAAGALVIFEGLVRDNHQGQTVERLEYQAFDSMAEKEGGKILSLAKDKFGIINALCQHRTGTLEVGELAVWIGVTSGHREEGFQACRFIIDQIKERVPIWKKEHYTSGKSHWVRCN